MPRVHVRLVLSLAACVSVALVGIKHVFIAFTDTGSTNTGPIELQGGTGAYTNLSGQGIDSGITLGDLGTGNITGVLLRT